MQSDRWVRLISFAVIILAILVQLQATFKIGGNDVRVNAADIALAVLAPIILFYLHKNFSLLKAISGQNLAVLVAVASVLISFSLFRGYETISGLSTWAAVRYVGWYILIYYLAVGSLISIVAGPVGQQHFTLGFIFFQIVMIAGFIVAQYRGQGWMYDNHGKFVGHAGNANAMAFYLICGFCAALTYIQRSDLSRRWGMAVTIMAAILFAGILFTKSVAALLATISVVLISAVIRVTTIKRLLQVVALGLSLWIAPQVIGAPPTLVVNVAHKLFGNVLPGSLTGGKSYPLHVSSHDVTVVLRMEGYMAAMEMWQRNPVFGEGLGVHLHHESLKKNQKYTPVQIHNTALWLLAETGLAGFLVLFCIFIVLFHKLWNLARSPPGDGAIDIWFPSAVLLILVGWSVMSLFHEMMYQRILWLLTGMALSAPVEPLGLWRWFGEKEKKKKKNRQK
jgi:O-antigen ligase